MEAQREPAWLLKMKAASYWHSLTGKEVIIFLKQLLRCCPGFIVLVWDNHPIHKRKLVQEFLAAQPRLIVYHFPTAAPELNPAEYIWAQISEHTAGIAPRNHKELRAIVMAGVARTRRSQRRFLSCPLATHLNWL